MVERVLNQPLQMLSGVERVLLSSTKVGQRLQIVRHYNEGQKMHRWNGGGVGVCK